MTLFRTPSTGGANGSFVLNVKSSIGHDGHAPPSAFLLRGIIAIAPPAAPALVPLNALWLITTPVDENMARAPPYLPAVVLTKCAEMTIFPMGANPGGCECSMKIAPPQKSAWPFLKTRSSSLSPSV